MKKALVFLLLSCYLTAGSGIVVHYHYCMNHLASADLFGSKNNSCAKCGMHIKKAHGCCHDEVKVVKAHGDQNKTQALVSLRSPVVTVIAPSIFLNTPACQPVKINSQNNHPPPYLPDQEIYLLNQVFRI